MFEAKLCPCPSCFCLRHPRRPYRRYPRYLTDAIDPLMRYSTRDDDRDKELRRSDERTMTNKLHAKG
jgi:hypothetical protein